MLSSEFFDLAPASRADRLLTARDVAVRFNVERSWVYAHADELGVIRLGLGPRPRLRFDAAVVAEGLRARPGATPTQPSPIRVSAGAPLLPIKRTRPRRTLDPG